MRGGGGISDRHRNRNPDAFPCFFSALMCYNCTTKEGDTCMMLDSPLLRQSYCLKPNYFSWSAPSGVFKCLGKNKETVIGIKRVNAAGQLRIGHLCCDQRRGAALQTSK